MYVFTVDAGMHESALHHQDRRDRFEASGRSECMANHTLGRGDWRQRSGRSSKRRSPGTDLFGIGSGRRQMAVDRIDLIWLNARVGQRVANTTLNARGIGRGHAATHPVASAVQTRTEQLGMDMCAAVQCALETLEQDNARTRTGNEAAGRCAEGS